MIDFGTAGEIMALMLVLGGFAMLTIVCYLVLVIVEFLRHG